MEIISKIINIFKKPKNTGYTYEAKTGIHSANNYSSSTASDYGSGSKFIAGIHRTAPINYHDHYRLRQKSRDAMYDSIEARSLIGSIVDNTVDVGLRLKPTPDYKKLGITPEKAEEWADSVAELFHLWAKSKKSHRSRVNNFYQNQILWELFKQRDNDVFVRFFYSKEKDCINPLQIEFVEPNQIRGYDYTTTYWNNPYEDGIVRDDKNREIGYKIWNYNPKTQKYTEKTIPAIGEKSKKILMIHGFTPEYANQGRGIPLLTPVLQELSDLTTYKLSVLQKAINQAAFVGVVENDFQDASQPLEGQIAEVIKEYGTPSAETIAAGTVNDDQPSITWDVNPEASINIPGAQLIGNLKRGDKLNYLKDTSPGPQYETFVNSVFSYISSATGDSIEVVLKKFSNNYSASRATLVLAWRKAQIRRDEMESDFLLQVYEAFLSEEIAAGRVSAPGWQDPVLRAAWMSTEWDGKQMPNIDPLKQVQADKEYVAMSAATLDDIARNYNGSSGKANRMKNTKQFKELPSPPWQPSMEMSEDDDSNKQEDK